MTEDSDSGGRWWASTGAADKVDRLLIAVCAGLWLAALGAAVAAIVALVGLAEGHSGASATSETPWLLYTVIVVSAAVIVGAVPLLVRARRASSDPSLESASESRPVASRSGDPIPVAQRLEPFGAPVHSRTSIPAAISRVGFPLAAVDQVWLRCTVIIVGAMGAAMTSVGVGTYLLASGHDAAAWTLFGLAGAVTALTPVAPWFFLRQLRDLLDASGSATN